MAKKSDILLQFYKDFPEYLKEYRTRSEKLERDLLRANNDYQSYLDEIDQMFLEEENKLTKKYLEIESTHKENKDAINKAFEEQFNTLVEEVKLHSHKTEKNYTSEDTTYQDILNQFEERKQEAFKTYVKLTNENDAKIDNEMKFHREFIESETQKLESKKQEYQELNSDLSNKLVWTMEKAKNSLASLSATLNNQSLENKNFFDDTINTSINNLNNSKLEMMKLFKTSTVQFEKQRNELRVIKKDKRKPHSELNQTIIAAFVKQIRDVKQNAQHYDHLVKSDLKESLDKLYTKILKADKENNQELLAKYIMQKEIIEKKSEYLLKRNQSMADLLTTKYQNEIKKIKIDSFKRYEEIQNTYSVPVAFFQNSVNVYSNFAFYLSETYEELFRMLNKFKTYNKTLVNNKQSYIQNTQKAFEDYKLGLLVKVNQITDNLTNYIQKIDNLSNKIVTLESTSRLEMSVLKKKMENLDIYGDYQKYLASLEKDQTIALYQHSKNKQSIQIESVYTTNLLDINKEVLSINQAKVEYDENERYLLEVANNELEIQELNHLRKLEEAKAKYRQQIDKEIALQELAKNQIIHNAMMTNYSYANAYVEFINKQNTKNKLDSQELVEFVNHAQKIVDLNQANTQRINDIIKNNQEDSSYLKALEDTKQSLIKNVNETKSKKNTLSLSTTSMYDEEIRSVKRQINDIFKKYSGIIKNNLIVIKSKNYRTDNLRHNGYKQEVCSLINYGYKTVVSIAYKYQIPSQIINLDKQFEEYLGKFLFENIETFKKLNKKSTKKPKVLLETYFIKTLKLLDNYQFHLRQTLTTIFDKISASDRAFLDNQDYVTDKNIKMINDEYEKLQFHAIKHQKNQKSQMDHYEKYANQINDSFKKQVEDFNKKYLNQLKTSKDLKAEIYKNFSRTVQKNNKELNNMIKYMDKLFTEEKALMEKQYDNYIKSRENIKSERDNTYVSEVAYIKTIHNDKLLEAEKTINVLDKKITTLPTDKSSRYDSLDKEKNDIISLTDRNLKNQLSKIEKEKYTKRPIYMAKIEEIKQKLPNDYETLYTQIQALEDEFLQEFSISANTYNENFETYLENQLQNNKLIDETSDMYQPFQELDEVNKRIIDSTNDTYIETISKSQKTRNELKKNKAQSEERKNRIINQ